MKRIYLVLILCLLTCLSFGATYYFSSSGGNDANTTAQAQSINTPWKTWGKFVSLVSAGTIANNDIIYFKRGDVFYTGTATMFLNRSVTVGAYGIGAIKPLISAFNTIPSNRWTLINATLGIWETTDTLIYPASNTLNVVRINGKLYAKGRTPNANTVNAGWLTYENHSGNNSITDNTNPFDASYVGGEIVIKPYRSNINIAAITGVSGNVISINSSTIRTTIESNGFGYFVQNSLKCLDVFGEWYYNRSTHKLDVCFGTLNIPSNFIIDYSSNDAILNPRASNLTVKDIAITGANQYNIFNDWQGLSNNNFLNLDLSCTGGDEIYLIGRNGLKIDGCNLWDNLSNGIILNYHNIKATVSNNYVYNTGIYPGMLFNDAVFRYGQAIFYSNQANPATDTGMTCYNNSVINVASIGIFYDGSNNHIDHNYVYNYCMWTDDNGGIYTNDFYNRPNPIPNKNNTVTNNLVGYGGQYAAYGTGTGVVQIFGFYGDNWVNNQVIKGNTFSDAPFAGVFLHNGNNCTVDSNLVYNNGYAQIYLQDEDAGDSMYNIYIKRNVLATNTSVPLMYFYNIGAPDSMNSPVSRIAFIDSNYIQKPFGTTITRINTFTVSDNTYNLAGWKGLSYKPDLNSKGTPFAITVPSQMAFLANTSTVNDSTINFICTNPISGYDRTYFNSVTLKPVQANLIYTP